MSRVVIEARDFLRGLPSRLAASIGLSHEQARALAAQIDMALEQFVTQRTHDADEEEAEDYATTNGHGHRSVPRPGAPDSRTVAGHMPAPVG